MKKLTRYQDVKAEQDVAIDENVAIDMIITISVSDFEEYYGSIEHGKDRISKRVQGALKRDFPSAEANTIGMHVE